jgi:hypothetical protein
MGLVAHPVFKTGRAEQPSAWKVRFLRRSVRVIVLTGGSRAGRGALRVESRPKPRKDSTNES